MAQVPWIYDEKPTNRRIRSFLKEANRNNPKWLQEPSYDRRSYMAVNKSVSQIRSNKTFENVFSKVHLINSVYSTRILNVSQAALMFYNKCKQLNFDKEVIKGNPALVDKMKRINLVSKKLVSKDFEFISFASKYCHCHQPELYPIYDRYVWFGLKQYIVKFKIKDANNNDFTLKDIPKSYVKYVDAVDAVRSWIQGNSKTPLLKYNELDRYLWIIGRIYFTEKICSNPNHKTKKGEPGKIILKSAKSILLNKRSFKVVCNSCSQVSKYPLTDSMRFLIPFFKK